MTHKAALDVPAHPEEVKTLRDAAIKLGCDDQFNLATIIAGNLGYDLAPSNPEIDPATAAKEAGHGR